MHIIRIDSKSHEKIWKKFKKVCIIWKKINIMYQATEKKLRKNFKK
jgi:hypothetical protein